MLRNFYNFSLILTFLHKLKEKIGRYGTLFKKIKLFYFIFQHCIFYLNLCKKLCLSRAEAGQDWTDSTTLLRDDK